MATKPRDYVRLTTTGDIFGISSEDKLEIVKHEIDDEGNVVETVTDIGMFVRAVEFPRAKVGDLAVLKIELTRVRTEVHAQLDEVVLQDLIPRRRPWFKRLRDATTFGAKSTTYVRA